MPLLNGSRSIKNPVEGTMQNDLRIKRNADQLGSVVDAVLVACVDVRINRKTGQAGRTRGILKFGRIPAG